MSEQVISLGYSRSEIEACGRWNFCYGIKFGIVLGAVFMFLAIQAGGDLMNRYVSLDELPMVCPNQGPGLTAAAELECRVDTPQPKIPDPLDAALSDFSARF